MTGRRTAVLVSGRGSNLQALIDAARWGTLPGVELVLVVANRPGAEGLARAQRAGIATVTVDHRSYGDRGAFDAALDLRLRDARIELVCLAGFMRVLTPAFVEAWRDRLLNVHPSLLPAFPGLHTHERVLAAGALVSGCTVHLVRPEVDSGPILIQGIVPVLAGDTPGTLAARVLEVEHRAFPTALQLFASGRLEVVGEEVRENPGPAIERLIHHPLLVSSHPAGRTEPTG